MIPPPGFSARRGYFAIAGAVVLLDQITKILAHTHLPGRGAVTIVPGAFNLTYSRNPGGLFGYFGDLPDPWRMLLLTLLPLVAIVMVVLFLARGEDTDRRSLLALALILGGAMGNLIDRVLRGEVVDFLDVYASWPKLAGWLIDKFGTAHWPTFNVADSAIVVGALLLTSSMFRREQATDARAMAQAEPPEPR